MINFAKLQIFSVLNLPYFLAKRITIQGQRTFSKLIVRVTIGAMAIAIMAIILAMAILDGFKKEVTDKQRGFFGDIHITSGGLFDPSDQTPFSLTAQELLAIKEHPKVLQVYPVASKPGIIKADEEVEGLMFKGVDPSYDQRYFSDLLTRGDTLDFASENAIEQVLLSEHTARRLLLEPGDTFIMYFLQERIRPRRLLVKGLFKTGAQEVDANYLIGNLELLQRVGDFQDAEVGGYELRVADLESIYGVSEELQEQLPDGLYARSILQEMPELFSWLEMLDVNDDVIFVLMSIVAVINIISALLISILERTSMIGVLKALGMNNWQIRKVFFFNSFYLIGYGLLIGNVLTMAVYFFQRTTHFFKLDPNIYYIDHVPMLIQPLDVVLLNVALAAVALFALLVPSLLIAKISPIKTIQFK